MRAARLSAVCAGADSAIAAGAASSQGKDRTCRYDCTSASNGESRHTQHSSLPTVVRRRTQPPGSTRRTLDFWIRVACARFRICRDVLTGEASSLRGLPAPDA
jgi:hypothetical protein